MSPQNKGKPVPGKLYRALKPMIARGPGGGLVGVQELLLCVDVREMGELIKGHVRCRFLTSEGTIKTIHFSNINWVRAHKWLEEVA